MAIKLVGTEADSAQVKSNAGIMVSMSTEHASVHAIESSSPARDPRDLATVDHCTPTVPVENCSFEY